MEARVALEEQDGSRQENGSSSSSSSIYRQITHARTHRHTHVAERQVKLEDGE